MNILPFEKQVEVISALCEGVSIRATERLTGVHRDTIMRLGVRAGAGCAKFHDAYMRDLNIGRIELDEMWSFVGKKQRHVTEEERATKGDQYIFTALASNTKAIITYRVGKRNEDTTLDFCRDLRERVLGAPEISTDGFQPYLYAVRRAFGSEVSHGQIIKKIVSEHQAAKEAYRRYSPGEVVSVERNVVSGRPMRISTSYVERQNLSMRMGARRLTRLTNAFSKKLGNHLAAISLYVSHYNFCRVHETLRMTPAMAQGLTDHAWTIGELLAAALDGVAPRDGSEKFRFKVIEGGKR